MKVTKRQLRRIIREEKARLLKEDAAPGQLLEQIVDALEDVIADAKMYAGAASTGRKKAIAYGASDAELAAENGRAAAYEDMHEMLLPILEMLHNLGSVIEHKEMLGECK